MNKLHIPITVVIYALVYITPIVIPEVTLAQVPAGHMCAPFTGQPEERQGSGGCSKGLSFTVDFSHIYKDMGISYNSTNNLDPVGMGKNFYLSEVSHVSLNNGAVWFRDGYGTYVPLELANAGTLKGSYLAKNRSMFPDYVNYNTANVWAYSFDGTRYKYDKLNPDNFLYSLASVINRFGERTDINISQTGNGFINYPDGERITYVRSTTNKNIVITSTKNPKNWATVVRNFLNNTTKIVLSTGVTHDFEYIKDTSLINKYTITSQNSRSESTYHYDSLGRLTYYVQDGIPYKFIRNNREKTVTSIGPDGKYLLEKFDNRGRIIARQAGVYGYESTPIEDHVYSYHPTIDRLESVKGPEYETKYLYHPTELTLRVGEEKYSGGVLESKVVNEIDPVTRYISLSTTTVSGTVVRQTRNTFEAFAYFKPALLKETKNEITKESKAYSYQNNLMVVTRKNSNGDSVLEERWDKNNLVKETNLLSATNTASTFSYHPDGKLDSISENGIVASQVKYDALDRVVYRKDANTEYFTKYNTDNYIEEERIKYSLKEEVSTFARELHPDGTVAKLLKTTKYPSETRVTVWRFTNKAESNELIDVSINGELL